MVDVDIYTNGDNSIDMLVDWLQIKYSRIEVNGAGSKAIRIPDGCCIDSEAIIIENNQPLEKAWKLDIPMPAKEIAALQSHMVDDLPLPKQVEVTAVSRTGEEKSSQISPQYDTTTCERGMQTHRSSYLCGIVDESSRERIDIIGHALPFYTIPDSEPVPDTSLCMIRNDTDYYSHFPRAYSAKAVYLYTGTDRTHWKFQHNGVHSMSQYVPGSIALPPYIAVYVLQVTEPFTYARVEIISGHCDGRNYVLKVHNATGNPIPDASDQNKNDGGGEGSDGQGGGRGGSPCVPDTSNGKDEAISWTIGQDASQISETVKREQRKKKKVNRIERHEGKPDAKWTTT